MVSRSPAAVLGSGITITVITPHGGRVKSVNPPSPRDPDPDPGPHAPPDVAGRCARAARCEPAAVCSRDGARSQVVSGDLVGHPPSVRLFRGGGSRVWHPASIRLPSACQPASIRLHPPRRLDESPRLDRSFAHNPPYPSRQASRNSAWSGYGNHVQQVRHGTPPPVLTPPSVGGTPKTRLDSTPPSARRSDPTPPPCSPYPRC